MAITLSFEVMFDSVAVLKLGTFSKDISLGRRSVISRAEGHVEALLPPYG
jgi:hypothetical protein